MSKYLIYTIKPFRIPNSTRTRNKLSRPSAILIPGWSGKFWSHYSPVFPIEFIIINYYELLLLLLLLLLYTVSLSYDFLYVIYTPGWSSGPPWPPYSLDDRRTTVFKISWVKLVTVSKPTLRDRTIKASASRSSGPVLFTTCWVSVRCELAL